MDQRLRPLPLPLPLPPLPIGSMPDQVATRIAQPQRAIAIYVECADAVIGSPGRVLRSITLNSSPL